MKWTGPIALFVAWTMHDVEEALTFPAACERLADRTGVEQLRITPRQSWITVGLMGVLVATACARGVQTGGRSQLYRAVAAGLEAHVATHLLASVAQRGYTPGVVTAVPVMLPGALIARRELARDGLPLEARDTDRGALLLIPAAVLCHMGARWLGRVAPESSAGDRP